MPIVPIPFANKPVSTYYGSEVNEGQQRMFDSYMTPNNNWRSRPAACTRVADLASGYAIDSLYYTDYGSMYWVISNTSMWKGTNPASLGTITYSGGTLDVRAADQKGSFATDGAGSVMVTKGKHMYYGSTGSSTLTRVSDADAPVEVEDIAFIDGYWVAGNYHDNKYYFSNDPVGLTNYPNDWPAGYYLAASRSSDWIVSLKVLNRLIFLFGSQSLEIHAPDGINPFSMISGGFFKTGCYCRESIIEYNNRFYWVSDKGQVVSSDGGDIQQISGPFDYYFQNSGTPSYRGERLSIYGFDFLIWTTSTNYGSIVYSPQVDQWYWWWDGTNFTNWIPVSILNEPKYNGWPLCGGKKDDLLSILITANYDLKDNDTKLYLKPTKITGNYNYGTTAAKRCREMRQRCVGIMSTGVASVTVTWQDDSTGNNRTRTFDAGQGTSTPRTTMIRRLMSPGIFRTRQYRWDITYSSDSITNGMVSISEPELDIEVLR